MPRKSGNTKRIDKKWFVGLDVSKTGTIRKSTKFRKEARAQTEAKKLRRTGFYARVIPYVGHWKVYYRPKPEKKR